MHPLYAHIYFICVCVSSLQIWDFRIQSINANISVKSHNRSTDTAFLCNRRCRYHFSPSPGTSACQTPHGAQKWCNCMSITTASVRRRWREATNRKAHGGEFPVTIASSSMPPVQMSVLPLSLRHICCLQNNSLLVMWFTYFLADGYVLTNRKKIKTFPKMSKIY